MNKKYRHKGNGKLYEIIREDIFDYFTIKQSSNNEWEEVVAYISCENHQPFITGRKRFNERFELVELEGKE